MSGDMDDRDLKALFDELRRGEEAQAPPFRLPPAGAIGDAARPGLVRQLALAVVLVVAAAAAILLLQRPHAAPAAPSLAQWEAPTGFLLDTPGSELLDSVSYDAVSPVTHLPNGERRKR